ncbi:hypothetical protein [Eikenella sp. Marseille-P7795]|uniref:hypothetical protein n=1 Tax=Eikenella sp. Marseille-P7795 TaxID=2866577 RepID=UPI001CE43D28|nr:hypothetical protein [Eikenella sp. Marseille-P7795]
MSNRPSAGTVAAAVVCGILIGLPAGEYISDTYRAGKQASLQAELDNAELRAGLYYTVNQSLVQQLTDANLAAAKVRADCQVRRQAASLASATRRDPLAGVVLEPAGE